MPPYASVIDIDQAKLPSAAQVQAWSGAQFAAALRHDQSQVAYNSSFRQLLHVGYKVAAQMGRRYTDALVRFQDVVAANVTQNLFDRHLRPIFVGET